MANNFLFIYVNKTKYYNSQRKLINYWVILCSYATEYPAFSAFAVRKNA